jgi:hypothetical protein
LFLPVHSTPPNDRFAIQSISYPLNLSSPLEGIISRLTRECGGNVHDQNPVKVTVVSSFTPSRPAKNVVDLLRGSIFASGDSPHGWIRFDFMTSRITPTHHLVRSAHDGGVGNWLLKEWVIDGSSDGTS